MFIFIFVIFSFIHFFYLPLIKIYLFCDGLVPLFAGRRPLRFPLGDCRRILLLGGQGRAGLDGCRRTLDGREHPCFVCERCTCILGIHAALFFDPGNNPLAFRFEQACPSAREHFQKLALPSGRSHFWAVPHPLQVCRSPHTRIYGFVCLRYFCIRRTFGCNFEYKAPCSF